MTCRRAATIRYPTSLASATSGASCSASTSTVSASRPPRAGSPGEHDRERGAQRASPRRARCSTRPRPARSCDNARVDGGRPAHGSWTYIFLVCDAAAGGPRADARGVRRWRRRGRLRRSGGQHGQRGMRLGGPVRFDARSRDVPRVGADAAEPVRHHAHRHCVGTGRV